MKHLLSLLSLLFVLKSSAQFVVSDPGSYPFYIEQIGQQAAQHGTAVKQLAEAKKTLETVKATAEEAKKTTSFLGEIKSAVDKVNNHLKSLEIIQRTIEQQQVSIERSQAAIQYVEKSGHFTQYEINMVIFNMTQFLNATSNSLALLKTVLQDDFFKMTDKERLDELRTIQAKVNSTRFDIDRLYETYTRLAGKRSMFKAFGQ